MGAIHGADGGRHVWCAGGVRCGVDGGGNLNPEKILLEPTKVARVQSWGLLLHTAQLQVKVALAREKDVHLLAVCGVSRTCRTRHSFCVEDVQRCAVGEMCGLRPERSKLSLYRHRPEKPIALQKVDTAERQLKAEPVQHVVLMVRRRGADGSGTWC